MWTVPPRFNCEKIRALSGRAKGTQFLVWDVGGQEKLRPLWKSYTRCTDAIVFVLDSVDVERMEEAKMELLRTAKSPDNTQVRSLWQPSVPAFLHSNHLLVQVPILILANKQDLPGAKDPKEIEKHLGLHELGSQHLFHVQPACAITGEGLDEGLDILYDMIHKRKKISKQCKGKKIRWRHQSSRLPQWCRPLQAPKM